MSRRLPPLTALRAFEAAARHLSFAKAASELNVTPAAVSHQIKALEAQLGVALFRRANRTIWLTEAAQACLPDLREGFDRLELSMQRLRGQQSRGLLTVSAPPAFAAKWLLGRLEKFRAKHPEIDLRLDASTTLSEFERDGVDIAVRYGLGRYGDVDTRLLLSEEVFPVCSPKLLEGPVLLREPSDLANHTLLHEDLNFSAEPYPDWRMWLDASGLRHLESDRGPRFSSSELALQSAIDGHGVALGRSVVVEADLAAGRLVKPFELAYPVAFAYYLVAPTWLAGTAKSRRLRPLADGRGRSEITRDRRACGAGLCRVRPLAGGLACPRGCRRRGLEAFGGDRPEAGLVEQHLGRQRSIGAAVREVAQLGMHQIVGAAINILYFPNMSLKGAEALKPLAHLNRGGFHSSESPLLALEGPAHRVQQSLRGPSPGCGRWPAVLPPQKELFGPARLLT